MRERSGKHLLCPNENCIRCGIREIGTVIRYGFYRVKKGRRRRYQCRACGTTFCATTQTPYHRLQHPLGTFDRVVALSVEGVSRSSIARVEGLSWNTVDRWLERAAAAAGVFNRGYPKSACVRASS